MSTDLQILSYLVNSPDEFDVLFPLFQQSEFEFQDKPLQLLFKCVSRTWEKANKIPTVAQVREQISRLRELKPAAKEILYDLTQEVYDGGWDEIDKDTILGRVLEPQRDQIMDIIKRIDPWNYKGQADLIRSKLDDMEILAHKDVGEVFDFFDPRVVCDIPAALATYLGGTISTGMPHTDEMLEGGFRRGELVMPAALPGDGKSMSCISLGCNMARTLTQSLPLPEYGQYIYYGILDNTAQEMKAKVWANFLRVPTRRLDTEATVPAKMQLVQAKYNLWKRMIGRKWPRKSKSIQDIRKDILLQERRRGIKFSVIIIDYLDVVKPGGFHKEERHGLDSVTVGLAALAEELGVVVVAPTQLHRAAKFIEVPDIDNLAEAFSKSWHAAVIYMILATKMERINGQCRWWWPKTRRLHEKWMMRMNRTNLYQEFSEMQDCEPYFLDDNQQEVTEHSKQSKRKEADREAAAKTKIDPSSFEVGKTNSPLMV